MRSQRPCPLHSFPQRAEFSDWCANEGNGHKNGHKNYGYTLTELLAVLAIITLIGGLSAGAFQYARRAYSLSATASRVEGLFLSARNTAVSWGVPVSVVADPASKTITAHAFEAVGEWGFEAAGESTDLVNAEIVDGHVGKGVRLGERGYVNCGASTRFDLRAGLYVEAWVWLDQAVESNRLAQGSTARNTRRRKEPRQAAELASAAIVAKGKAYYLGVAGDGTLEAAIGEHIVRSAPAALLPGRWTLVALQYDGKEVAIFTNELERDTVPSGYEGADPKDFPAPPQAIPLDLEPLTIGSPRGSFSGRIDEVRLRGLAEPVFYTLDPAFKILGWKKIIRFDRRGHLDPRFHERPVRLMFFEEASVAALQEAKTQVLVDYSLTFQEWLEKSGRGFEELQEEEEERKIEEGLIGRRKSQLMIDRIGSVR